MLCRCMLGLLKFEERIRNQEPEVFPAVVAVLRELNVVCKEPLVSCWD